MGISIGRISVQAYEYPWANDQRWAAIDIICHVVQRIISRLQKQTRLQPAFEAHGVGHPFPFIFLNIPLGTNRQPKEKVPKSTKIQARQVRAEKDLIW